MDIVIPFKHSLNKDEELRFTLRSFQKNLLGAEHVFIIGDNPAWTVSSEVTVIPMADRYDPKVFKDRNILNKLLMACHDDRVANDGFIAADDDQFLLAPVEARWCPPYHRGSVWTALGDYGETEKNTLSLFSDKKPKNFNTHSPFIVLAPMFQRNMTTDIDWQVPHGYSIKTVYCTRLGISGEFYHNELKVKGSFTKDELEDMITAGMRYVTCEDSAWRYGMNSWMLDRFPDKSKYEL